MTTMKKAYKQNYRNFFLFLLIANILFLLSNTVFVLHKVRNPPDKVFSLMHGDWFHDFYSLISFITEGQNGFWLKREQYTTENIPPTMLHFYYIAVGQLSNLFSIDSFTAYHVARIISVELFFLALFAICSLFVEKRIRILAALLSLLAGIPSFSIFKESVNLQNYPGGIPWWIVYDALERLNNYPHHTFGQMLLLIVFVSFVMFIRNKKGVFLLCAIVSLVIGSIAFPPILIPLIVCIPMGFVLYGLKNIRKNQFSLPLLSGLFLFIAATAIIYLYIKYQFAIGSFWNTVNNWELNRWNKDEPFFDFTLFRLFGLLPFFALPATVRNILKGKWEDYILCLWAFLPFLLLPAVNIVGVPKVRLIQIANFVPLSILTIQTFSLLSKILRKKIILPLGVMLILAASTPQTIGLLQQRVQSFDYYASGHQYHIPISTYKALMFIAKNVPKDSVILAEPGIGNMIPAYAPVISVVGHFVGTINYSQKVQSVSQFYTSSFTQEQARDFVSLHSIDYVYYGEEEKTISAQKSPSYSFLSPVYDSEDVLIWQVVK